MGDTKHTPVAWRWEGRDRAGYWSRMLTGYNPQQHGEQDNEYCRNVEPLYLHPAGEIA